MSQAERAIESLYEDTNLREELVDSEARLLLQWGEKRIADLARRNLPDAQFDEALDNLRQLLKRINRYIGRRAHMTPEEQQNWLVRIVEAANTLGYNVTLDQMNMDFQAQGVVDNHAALNALMAMIEQAKVAPQSGEDLIGTNPLIVPTDVPLLPDSHHTGDVESNDEEIQPP
jgi:hypothetical protein